uniref:Aminotransferase-like protein n=2 Tax=Oryza sativa subsp. japonica TaxID=39947 RepID=Q8L666_ORYSJ|nr:Unknown protein [Oryza sativa Japonica Group]AAP52694.1 hypothetical protein LOC_Os10g13470 [Oryza sativa Japonica Group]
MASASYFWSNTLNAFMFNQGPMTPTLLDVIMITGLDVTSSANPMNLNSKNQFDFMTKSIGGSFGYVDSYMGKGSVTPREHTTFLLMWLEKFLFCESSCGPITNWQFLAEALEAKKQIPLGKILLGYLYQMLNNTSAKIAVGSVVGAEAASTPADSRAKLSAELLKDWFCSFYEGFQKDARVWFTYEDSVEFELPSDFIFEDINSEKFDKSIEVFSAAISPSSMYMTDLFPDVIPQTTESSPPHKSNSGKDIEYALGLIPNGGGLAPPVISYHAPRTSSLLQGQLKEPADAGRKRKTKALAVDPSALAPKKKAKKKKSKPTDDLPVLNPSIEQALDEEEIEEDVDQAATELSDLGEKTPSASPKQTPPTPAAPAHFSRKKKTVVKKKSAPAPSKLAPPPPPPPSSPVQPTPSDHTPSAAGSHNIEEEEQTTAPSIPVLADMLSFDIKDYFDEEAEEETTSKTLAPLDEDVKRTLEDISHRLESSLDNLVAYCGSIRARFAEIQALVPDDLANTISSAVYLKQHQFKMEKAKQRIADRREQRDIEATIQANQQLVHEEKAKLDQLYVGPIQSNKDRFEARKIDLIAQLEECNAKLDLEKQKLANLPNAVEEQKSRLRSAIKNVADMTKSLKVIPGTDAQDIQAIEEVDQIRQRVVSAIQRYLSG